MNATQSGIPRRGLLQKFLGFMSAVYAACFVYPIVRFLRSGGADEGGEQVTQISLPEGLTLEPDSHRMFKFGSKTAILIRHSETEFSAFIAKCTHLGCTVDYEPSPRKRIYCACHGGQYDPVTGKNTAGPPPKPLPKLEVEVKDGDLVIKT